MGRKATELTPLAVQKLKTPGLHFVGGVSGLALQVLPTGGRTWVMRAVTGGRRRDMGLGGYPDVTLQGAREAAREARAKIRSGIDPIEEGRAKRSQQRAEQAAAKTFDQCAEGYIKAMEKGWKNAKHSQQWRNTLATYAGCVGLTGARRTERTPKLGSMLVRDIGKAQVLEVLEAPDVDGKTFWESKTETASRVRNRIELVLAWAAAKGYRDEHVPNPARWKGYLDKLLLKPSKVEHHAALPFAEIGAFIAKLREQEGMGARALEFAILTAARSGEVRGATWPEIDLKGAIWTIPGDRMKGGREHRVPLSEAAVDLLKGLPRIDDNELVFPAPRGGLLSDMTLTAVLRRMGVDAVPHGFRSTFRDWAAESTNYPREMAEMALAHKIADAVEAAYRRGDLFNKRRRMMNDWSAFCAKSEVRRDNVVSMKRRRQAT